MFRLDLDGDGAVQPGIAGTPPHAALAEEGGHVVVGEPRADVQGHNAGLVKTSPFYLSAAARLHPTARITRDAASPPGDSVRPQGRSARLSVAFVTSSRGVHGPSQ